MAHGVTNMMRNLRKPAPEWIVEHTRPSGWDRRHFRTMPNGAVVNWPKGLRAPAVNVPYVNPARDSKPTRRRRLRKELRS